MVEDDRCEVMYCIGARGHGGETHFDNSGTSWVMNEDDEAVIVHTYFDPWKD